MGAVMEIFAGANHSLQMLCGLVGGAARTLLSFGTERQKHEYLPRLISGDCLATMCMTEADAGSDLSRIRTRAVPDGAAWRISGEKIFISGGDQDLSEGILHLVLARTGDHGSGTRGLSLFLCRSHEEQGRRNSIRLVRIEEKLGLHASPTCQLSFEDATAEMIGQPGEGLKAMFVMMNHARIDVALQGVAHAARACDVASEFAARRVQGRHPGSALPVSIEAHGDVRRMLQEQGTLAVSGRALCYVALVELDVGQNPGLMDFLTPVCKFYCSEGGIRAANLGIQVLGGYGYLREYGMEQVLRDARIRACYPGFSPGQPAVGRGA
jgi:alkylation response protein AidB-like acyl-CoA dehydrogenase